MKIELHQDSAVGYVKVDPYEYEYTGAIEEVEQYLASEPVPTRGEDDPDWNPDEDSHSAPEREYETTGKERLDAIASAVMKRGVWAADIVE